MIRLSIVGVNGQEISATLQPQPQLNSERRLFHEIPKPLLFR